MRPYKHVTIVFFASMGILVAANQLYGFTIYLLLIPAIVYLVLLIIGSANIRWCFYLPIFNKGYSTKEIALSFDDGPASETTAILDVLREHNVQATFFTIGHKVLRRPEIVQRWHREGHLIGNHSYYHRWLFVLQPKRQIAAEIEATNKAIAAISGVQPLFFRPPFGVTNPLLASAVKRTGMITIGWSIRSMDTVSSDPNQLLDRILRQLKGGDIILLHDTMPVTKEILTSLILGARERGFTFVRIDQLLQIKAYA